MGPSKLKSGVVTIERTFTTATYEYVKESSLISNTLTLMYSSNKNWQTPGKIALSLSEIESLDLLLLRGCGYETYIPRRLLEPLRIILHLDEKLNAVSRMDTIKVHQENK
jgi:hypothetical protein